MSARPWKYQAPERPAAYPDQCYYRAGASYAIRVDGLRGEDTPDLTVYRNARQARVSLSVGVNAARMSIDLDPASILALRNAFNDVLQDVEPIEAERERVESFERIQDDLRAADELGGAGCYYCHPDVHYVPADQVAAKVRELEAAGVSRYIVLPEPADAPPVARAA